SHLGTAVGLAPQRSVSLPGKNAGERIGRRGRAGHVAIVVTGPVGGQGLVPNRGQPSAGEESHEYRGTGAREGCWETTARGGLADDRPVDARARSRAARLRW